MRRLLVLTLILLLLVSCVQQKPEEAMAPVQTDPIEVEVEVTVPTIIQVQEAYWRTGSWDLAFDFEQTDVLPRFKEGELRLTLESQPAEEHLENLPETATYVQHHGIHILTFAVHEEDETIRLPEWLRHEGYEIRFEDVPHERVIAFNPAYPWLQQTRSGFFNLHQGDTVGFKLIWPFDKEVVDTALKEILSRTPHEVSWAADNEVHVTILGGNQLGLHFRQIPDLYGCTPLSFYEGPSQDFTLRVSNAKLFAVELASGKETEVPVPIPLEGISGFSDDGRVLNLYVGLGHYTEVSSQYTMYEYTYDLDTGTVKPVGTPYTTPHSYASTMSEADRVLRPLCEPEGIWFYRQTMSPSGRKAAAITGYGPDSAMLVLDIETGELERWHLGNDYPLGSCRPVEPLLWSYDERYVIYESTPKEMGEAIIYRLDVVTGEQVVLGRGVLQSVSPNSEHMVIIQVDHNEFNKILGMTQSLVDFEGERTSLLDVGNVSWPRPGPWVGSEQIVFNRQFGHDWEWYYYNMSTGEWSAPSPGRALAYDPVTSILYVQR